VHAEPRGELALTDSGGVTETAEDSGVRGHEAEGGEALGKLLCGVGTYLG
jgi:hypothetical protein